MRKKAISIIMTALIASSAASLAACTEIAEETPASGTVQVTQATKQSDTSASQKATQPSADAETTAKSTKASAEKSNTESSSNSKASSGSAESSKSGASSQNAGSATSSKTNTSSKASSSKAQSSNAQQSGTFSASDAVFTYNGKSVSLGDNMSDVLSKLGSADSVTSAPSCHGVGEDKTYTYSGFEIYTYPDNGNDYVLEILVTSSSVPTSKGVTVGDTEDKVISTYGKNYTTSGFYYVYDAGSSKSLQFYMNNGVVQQIDYYYNV